MKLVEVVRPSDKAAERAKIAAKQEAMRNRVVNAYVRGLTAPQYKPHANDVSRWLFGIGLSDEEAMNELKAWTTGVGFMVNVDPNEDPKGTAFRTFSHFINVPHEMVDFVCNGGILEEPKK
jgi:hypothetical protein